MELVWKRGKANFKISRADLADFPLRTLRKGKKGGGGGGGLAVCGGRARFRLRLISQAAVIAGPAG